MAISERNRAALYQVLSELINEEAAGEMLSYFPAREADEPASRDYIDARLSEMEARLTATFNAQIETFNAQMRTMVQWTLGAVVALVGLVVAMGVLQSP